MSYENAWKEMVSIISNIKENQVDGDIDSLLMCVEYLQSELEKEEESQPAY